MIARLCRDLWAVFFCPFGAHDWHTFGVGAPYGFSVCSACHARKEIA